MSRYDARVDGTVAAVQAANPLPATLDELSPSDRAHFEAQASWRGITPEAALAITREERARAADLDSVVERALAAVRAARG